MSQKIRIILHPTDFSPAAEAAFSMANLLARAHKARIIVLHVYPPTICHGEAVARRQDDSFEADLWRQLDQYHAVEPDILVERHLIEGNPAEEIVRLGDLENVDLIVMGTHGRAGFGRLLMGSVAQEVMNQANCPVVTVHNPLVGRQPKAAAREEPAVIG